MARPPRLPDAAILSVIAELRGQHAVLTGTCLREELTRRHGSPCGVSRIYRLLREATQPAHEPARPAPTITGDLPQLQRERDEALERARLAEHREDHHLARWAGEIHALREQVRTHADAAHRLRIVEGELKDRSRELAAAYYRLSDLETELRALRGD
jgi:hypothetical protein